MRKWAQTQGVDHFKLPNIVMFGGRLICLRPRTFFWSPFEKTFLNTYLFTAFPQYTQVCKISIDTLLFWCHYLWSLHSCTVPLQRDHQCYGDRGSTSDSGRVRHTWPCEPEAALAQSQVREAPAAGHSPLQPDEMVLGHHQRDKKCWRGRGGKGTLVLCGWECTLVQPLWETA